jgi:hypothetical protein
MKAAMKSKNSKSREPQVTGFQINDVSSRQAAFLIGKVGTIIGAVVIAIGLAAMLLKTPTTQYDGRAIDSDVMIKADAAIKKNDFIAARKVLENEESLHGLSIEASERLDTVYLALAQTASTRGDRQEAINLLKLIPLESKHYGKAQQEMKKLTAEHSSTKKKVLHKNHGKKASQHARRHS